MADFDPSGVSVARVVDARGSACPGPLLEAKRAVGAVSVGQTVEVLSSDPSTKKDIPKWSEKVGHEFLGTVEAEGYDRLFVTRRK